ncbi:MAG: hypothetical protein HGA26_08300 [Chlorobiaceae bacterium]|nr:hypothetical protein [Chlorobiaceae bacterium]
MKKPMFQALIRLFILTFVLLAPGIRAFAGEVNLSIAASLKEVINDLTAAYTAKHPATTFVKNFGGSGTLAGAIETAGGVTLSGGSWAVNADQVVPSELRVAAQYRVEGRIKRLEQTTNGRNGGVQIDHQLVAQHGGRRIGPVGVIALLQLDADDVAGIEYWDGNLVSTDIHNFDLRWELFPSNGQTFSVSGFYKMFDNPIEMVQYATLAGSFQPRNVGDGQVFGTEIEFRLNLEPIIEALRNLTISSNLTFAKSLIRLSNTEYQSRTENARTGQTIDEYRDMAGQAPFIINFGVSYNGGVKGFWNGFEAGLYYNVQGQTLQYVGMVDRPDIYVRPFHSLNFNSNKSLGENNRLQIGLKIENLLNATRESVFISYEATDQYFTRLNQGITFQLRLSYSLF